MDDDEATALNDDELVVLTRRGSGQAYASLFTRHGPALRLAASGSSGRATSTT